MFCVYTDSPSSERKQKARGCGQMHPAAVGLSLSSLLDTLSIFSSIVRSGSDSLPSSLLWWNVNSRCVNNCGPGQLGERNEVSLQRIGRENYSVAILEPEVNAVLAF